ncbi:MAG: trypsin-like peptidase domain-containing protein [Acidimicrobiales bacterium]
MSGFSAFRASIVRIYDSRRSVTGVGCLVGGRLFVTCAHVVGDALGGSGRDVEPPAGEVEVDFPLIPGRPGGRASVVEWVPILGDGQGDIALLALAAEAPEPARPVRLVTSTELWGHEYRAYGIPAGLDGGEWASGKVSGPQAAGWLQLNYQPEGGRIQRGYSGGPVWDDTLGGVVGIVVATGKSAGGKAGYLIPAVEILHRCAHLLPEQGKAPCPYQGLVAFRELHAATFFGREQAVEDLVGATAHRSLVAVLGSSGCGKSSVVFAGLTPRLRRSGRWKVADLRPGRHPFDRLAAALVPLLLPDLDSSTNSVDRLKATPEVAELITTVGLPAVLRRLTEMLDGQRLLVVVDQFEELFTLCPDADIRLAFIDAILEAARAADDDPEPSVLFVLTMRADFLSQALAHRPLADALQGADVKLGPMNQEELAAAIERPAADLGVRFEEGLVTRILDELRSEPGHLPLLEFALTLLWDRQRDGMLTHEAYEAVGRVDAALTHYADAIYTSLPPEDQERARRVFVQLVRPGDGTEDTRRLATAGELSDGDWRLVRRLATKRLVVTDLDPAGDETAEVAHEALIRGWGRLRDWLTTDREFRLWQERLRDALRQWRARKDDAALLRGVLLGEAEEWGARRPEEVSGPEQHFVALSRQRQDEQAERYRLLYEAALARQLAARADLLRDGDRAASELGVLLAVEAVRLYASFDTDLALRRAIAGLGDSEAADCPARPAPIGDLTVLVEREVVRVRRGAQDVVVVPYRGWIHATALSAEGHLLAMANDDWSAWVVDVRDGQVVDRYRHDGLVNAVAFSADATLLATGGDDGVARVWDVGGAERRRFPHEGLVNSVAFSPDASRLATAGQDGQARVWDVGLGAELHRLPSVGDMAVAFDDEGAFLCSGAPPWRRWPLRPQDLIAAASRLVGRDLTQAERSTFMGDDSDRPTGPDVA